MLPGLISFLSAVDNWILLNSFSPRRVLSGPETGVFFFSLSLFFFEFTLGWTISIRNSHPRTWGERDGGGGVMSASSSRPFFSRRVSIIIIFFSEYQFFSFRRRRRRRLPPAPALYRSTADASSRFRRAFSRSPYPTRAPTVLSSLRFSYPTIEAWPARSAFVLGRTGFVLHCTASVAAVVVPASYWITRWS